MKLSDYVINADYTDKQMSQARNFLLGYKEFTRTANFAVVGASGISTFYSQACHYSFQSVSRAGRALVATEFNLNHRHPANAFDWNKDYSEDKKFFRDWFAKESHFAKFILNQDDDSFQYGWIMPADVPAPLLQNINITSRHGYEVSSLAFKLFREYVEKGYNPYVMFNCCFSSYLSTIEPSLLTDKTQVYSHTGHRAWGLLPTPKSLFNLIEGEMGTSFTQETPTYRQDANYWGGSAYCKDESYTTGGFFEWLLRNDKTFKEIIREYRKEPPEPAIKNPFARTNYTSYNANLPSFKELFEIAIPYVMELYNADASQAAA